MTTKIAIIGCGKLGSTLAFHLSACGYPIDAVFSQSQESAKNLAHLLGIGFTCQTIQESVHESDIIFITTPDNEIEKVCREIADHKGFKKGAIVFHCSGAHPSTILTSAKICHAFIGSFHPLQSFASVTTATNPFSGIIISVEGDPEALVQAETLVNNLRAQCLKINTKGKTLYHAAAVCASNYLVTLLDMSFQYLKQAGIEATDAMSVLYPLISGTLKNVEKVGIPEALTGPVSRGDAGTIVQHLNAIKNQRPEYLQLYKVLGLYTTDISHLKGSINKNTKEKLRTLFE